MEAESTQSFSEIMVELRAEVRPDYTIDYNDDTDTVEHIGGVPVVRED